jgi:hypothetical protein
MSDTPILPNVMLSNTLLNPINEIANLRSYLSLIPDSVSGVPISVSGVPISSQITTLDHISSELSNYQGDVSTYYANIPSSVSSVTNEHNAASQALADWETLNTAKNEESNEDAANKMRLVELNTYYSKKYNEQSDIMKIVIVTCVVVLFLWFLDSKEFTPIPSSVYTFLIALVFAIGIIVIFFKCYYLLIRDNVDFDQFDFQVKDARLPKIGEPTDNNTSSSGASSIMSGSHCQDDACCPIGFAFNSGLGRCSLF